MLFPSGNNNISNMLYNVNNIFYIFSSSFIFFLPLFHVRFPSVFRVYHLKSFYIHRAPRSVCAVFRVRPVFRPSVRLPCVMAHLWAIFSSRGASGLADQPPRLPVFQVCPGGICSGWNGQGVSPKFSAKIKKDLRINNTFVIIITEVK